MHHYFLNEISCQIVSMILLVCVGDIIYPDTQEKWETKKNNYKDHSRNTGTLESSWNAPSSPPVCHQDMLTHTPELLPLPAAPVSLPRFSQNLPHESHQPPHWPGPSSLSGLLRFFPNANLIVSSPCLITCSIFAFKVNFGLVQHSEILLFQRPSLGLVSPLLQHEVPAIWRF